MNVVCRDVIKIANDECSSRTSFKISKLKQSNVAYRASWRHSNCDCQILCILKHLSWKVECWVNIQIANVECYAGSTFKITVVKKSNLVDLCLDDIPVGNVECCARTIFKIIKLSMSNVVGLCHNGIQNHKVQKVEYGISHNLRCIALVIKSSQHLQCKQIKRHQNRTTCNSEFIWFINRPVCTVHINTLKVISLGPVLVRLF